MLKFKFIQYVFNRISNNMLLVFIMLFSTLNLSAVEINTTIPWGVDNVNESSIDFVSRLSLVHYRDKKVIDSRVTTFVEDSHVNIFNPDRGFYSADYPLTDATDYNIFSKPKADGYYIVYAPINLYDYINRTTLPTSLLETIDRHLTDAEESGVKLILRLKYRKNMSDSYKDPSLSTILGHIEQLKETLQTHKEIISVVQVGTLGAWGEWHKFTGEFAESDSNYKVNRRAVVEKLIEVFPNKYVQIRTPMHKEFLYGISAEYKDEETDGKITPEIAYTDDIRAKIGHHNDCFLVDETNYGTYGSNVEFWKDYVADDSKYAPVGGETCGINSSKDEYLSNCDNAVAEMKYLQYSYLNNVYHSDVLNKWKEQGCYEEIKENLGYRLVATQLEITRGMHNRSLVVDLKIENKGFASPYIPSSVNLLLKNSEHSYTFYQPNIDMRTFYASEIKEINSKLPVEDVKTGEYCLYLQIGEGFSAIRLSNSQNSDGVDIWDEELKINKLKCEIFI